MKASIILPSIIMCVSAPAKAQLMDPSQIGRGINDSFYSGMAMRAQMERQKAEADRARAEAERAQAEEEYLRQRTEELLNEEAHSETSSLQSVRQTVGKLLAQGDCQAAKNYALISGDINLAIDVRNYCTEETKKNAE